MVDLRRLTIENAADAARVHRSSFDERLPWLAGLHTPTEDAEFYRIVVFAECRVWGAFEDNELLGVMALRQGWIDQLYVLPEAQSQGIGSGLISIAKSSQSSLSLWTFQKNVAARRFYEQHGFTVIEETDGLTNEEKEPDVRYEWRKTGRLRPLPTTPRHKIDQTACTPWRTFPRLHGR